MKQEWTEEPWVADSHDIRNSEDDLIADTYSPKFSRLEDEANARRIVACDTALARAEAAEAACAAKDEALKLAKITLKDVLRYPPRLLKPAVDAIDAALSTDAGSPLLDEVKRLREEGQILGFILEHQGCPTYIGQNCEVDNCGSDECIEVLKTYCAKQNKSDRRKGD